MLICVLLAIACVAAIVAWGGLGIVAPAVEASGGRMAVATRRYLWWADLIVIAGLTAGLLAAGAGGRLAMRLLAVTSPDARGALTEADQTVGRITVSGTMGLIVFAALPFGLLAAFQFALIYRWLPGGRRTGLLFGVLLLITASTRLDPLRSSNPDFRLLGPAWLAASTLGLVVLADAMLTAGIAGWYSRRLPLPARGWSALRHDLATVALLLLVFIIGVPVLVLTAVGAGLVAVVALTAPSIARGWTSRRMTMVGRVLLAGGSLVALPGFVTAINNIIR
jgi:hypothetical protein